MRTMAILGAAAAGFLFASGAVEAARWCHTGAQARGCAFNTRAQCLRIVRRDGGACRVQAATRRPAPVEAGPAALPSGRTSAPGQIYPDRPYGAAPGACFTDDGGGRFRHCSAGGGSN